MRCTTDRIPSTSQLLKDSQIPYGIIVKPLGDMPNVSFYYFIAFIKKINFFYKREKKFLLFHSKMTRL